MTIAQSGYQYIRFYRGSHILYKTATGVFEQWVKNKKSENGLKFRNTLLQFVQQLA